MGSARRDREHFAAIYRRGRPPWETGHPEPWVLRLLDDGVLRGNVLDAGCGTGRNAVAMAGHGCRVTAIDFVPEAVAAARERARQAAVEDRTRVLEADVFEWDPGDTSFDAVLDCGFFHGLDDEARQRYVERLSALLRRGGHLVMMCFSDREPGDEGPRRVTALELCETFGNGWEIERLERTRFGGASGEGNGPHAWILVARLLRVPHDPRRFLLVSDTHGVLAGLPGLAERLMVDAILHAGDFGFYSSESIQRLSERELRLAAGHGTPIPGDLPRFIAGELRFPVPVLATWGNHEDAELTRALREGLLEIHNLHVLGADRHLELPRFSILGLGGNLVPGYRMLGTRQPRAGVIYATLADQVELVRAADALPADLPRVLLVHVDPAEEPWAEYLAMRVGAGLTISGHMHRPRFVAWKRGEQGTAIEEAARRLEEAFHSVRDACLRETMEASNRRHRDRLARAVEEAFSLFHVPFDEMVDRRRDWYDSCLHLNLPLHPPGAVVLEVDGSGFHLEEVSRPGDS